MIERRQSKLWAVEALFDQLNDGVCIADGSRQLLYVNPAARRLLELPEHAKTLDSLCQLLCERLQGPGLPEAARRCPLRTPAISGAERSVTFVGSHGPRPGFKWDGDSIRRADRFRDLRVRCLQSKLPLAGVEEDLHIVLVEDASSASELQRHKEDWRAMIAHDLRAPMTGVYAGLRLLEDAHPKSGKTDLDADVVQMGLRSCRRMMELLDLYLEVARFDAGAAKAALEPVSVLDAAESAVSAQEPLMAARGVIVELDIPKDLSAQADTELFTRALENLINNAIKYGAAPGTIRVGAREKGGEVIVSVADDGPGIEAKDLPFLFDRFYQADARRAGRIKGNGLGLTFCREAAALMNGSITADSQPEKGATFTLTLPKALP